MPQVGMPSPALVSEAYIQGLIDASITTHIELPSAHHSRYTNGEALSAIDLPTHEANADAHHIAPAHDSEAREVVFQIP